MNELRKGFYVLDMVVLAFFLFAINHSMYFENWIVEAALDLAIPWEYRFILPTKCYSPFARCVKENSDSVIRNVEYGYVLK